MSDVDIDPLVEHESGPEEPTDECIPLTSVGRSTCRLATSLFPKSPQQTHSTARNLSTVPKQKEVEK